MLTNDEVEKKFSYYSTLQEAAFEALRQGDRQVYRYLTNFVHSEVEKVTKQIRAT